MRSLKVVGIALGAFLLGLTILGFMSSVTGVYAGEQIPAKYVAEIKSLGLLDEQEAIQYFYTYGMLDIKKGFYLVSDQYLTFYRERSKKSVHRIRLKDLVYISAEYGSTRLSESIIWIETSERSYSFRLPCEQGHDKACVAYIATKAGIVEGVRMHAPLPEKE